MLFIASPGPVGLFIVMSSVKKLPPALRQGVFKGGRDVLEIVKLGLVSMVVLLCMVKAGLSIGI